MQSQRAHNFEWYLVNDGSTDGTEELVQSWLHSGESKFTIHYFRKENGGKHRAINDVVPVIDALFTMIVDSDDYLCKDATATVGKWLEEAYTKKYLAGVAGLRGYPDGRMIGSYPRKIKPGGYIEAKNTERIRKHLTGDKAEVYRTAILKKYPFPEIKGEKFIPESVVWNAIALDGYAIRWYNRIIYISEYLEDGLTKNLDKNRLENWKGYTLDTAIVMKSKNLSKYRYLGRYLLIAKNGGVMQNDICKTLNINNRQYLLGKATAMLQVFWDLLQKKNKENK